MILTETRDKEILRVCFARNPWRHLYQWGDLASPAFEQSRWFVALDEDGSAAAVLVMFGGVQIAVALPSGNGEALRELLSRFGPELPDRFYAKLEPAHEPAFADAFELENPVALTVMGLDKFQPRPQPPRTTLQLLTPRHMSGPLASLYAHYPGNWFDPSQLENGLYAGAWARGRLVSAAGTHAFAPAEGVAALGNIVTHAEFRGRGLCAATLSFLIRELRREGCRYIGLHVESHNAAAIACYERVGFRTHLAVTQYLAGKRGA